MYLKRVNLAGWRCFENCSIDLTDINVLLGKNNSGKSSFVRSMQALQPSSLDHASFLRLGSPQGQAQFFLTDIETRRFYPERSFPQADPNGTLREALVVATLGTDNPQRQITVTHQMQVGNDGLSGVGHVSQQEPNNFLYLYLSKRKTAAFQKSIDLGNARLVSDTFQHLVSKVAALSNPGHPENGRFVELCKQVLDIPIGTVPIVGGAHVGLTIGSYGSITLESMGDGVTSLLGLIADLCVANGNLFLLEEPENDIHPQGLKTLLEVIIEKSATNQFVVSTHSNIVARYLGSARNSQVLNVELTAKPPQVPTAQITKVEGETERIKALRHLGYELYDFGLADGWIFFEEASAEGFVRDYFTEWFAPKLTRVTTVSAYGTSDVEPTVKGFEKLFLFIHRGEAYRERAWVLVDGDDSGKEVIAKFHQGYKSWPADHFRYFSKPKFEDYYPERFQGQVTQIFAMTDRKARQEAKKALSAEVRKWCDEEPETAKAEFETSAAEVIDILLEIEAKVVQE